MVLKATQEVSVNLDKSQQKLVTVEYLCEQADWKTSYYINEDDGWVYDDRECHTTHSFNIQQKVRVANNEDRLINKIFKNHYFNL